MIECTTSTSKHAPGTPVLNDDVAMSVEDRIHDRASALGIDIDYVDPYQNDRGNRVYHVVKETDGSAYRFDIVNKVHPEDPTEFFDRALDRELQRLQERLPDR